MIDLNGLRMHVSATAANGVVDSTTILEFHQRGRRVWATYCGGRVSRGWLVGRWANGSLSFRYVQREANEGVHGGRSLCETVHLADGRIRIRESFQWDTRQGSGVNVFDEVRD